MASKLKPAGRLAIVVLVGLVVFFSAKWYTGRPKTVGTSQTIGKVTVPDTDDLLVKTNLSFLFLHLQLSYPFHPRRKQEQV